MGTFEGSISHNYNIFLKAHDREMAIELVHKMLFYFTRIELSAIAVADFTSIFLGPIHCE
jgi:hypothetical protein